ncbi:MAG: hypothetical protein AAF960_08440 [Bacteroidota bacterium]
MKEILLDRYLKILEPLSVDFKLAIVSALTENIRESFSKKSKDKVSLFNELKGAWSDMSFDIENKIYNSRTISDKES